MRALLDTSVFVATETGRPLADMPGVDGTEISVITLAELTIGALLADDESRAARLATLAGAESDWQALPVSLDVARIFAGIVAELRAQRRRVPTLDALIAATAIAEGIPVVTQDRDYDAIPGVDVIQV